MIELSRERGLPMLSSNYGNFFEIMVTERVIKELAKNWNLLR